MDTKELISKLESLMKLDVDAEQSYDTALDKIKETVLHDQIAKFRDDHRRHVESLSDLIIALGAQPPAKSTDIRGIFLGGLTALRSITGTEGALKSIQMGEKLTNKEYGDSMNWIVPPEVKAVLTKNYDDEQRHLRFVNTLIDEKAWEKPSQDH